MVLVTGLLQALFILALGAAAFFLSRRHLGDAASGRAIFARVFRYVVVAFTGFMLCLILFLTVSNFLAVRKVASLDAREVTAIRVGETLITDPDEIREIVRALNGARSYEDFHPVSADQVDMEVIGQGGSSQRFRVSLRREESGLLLSGAVLWFYRDGPHGSTINCGCALCEDLPAALEKVGISLPGL